MRLMRSVGVALLLSFWVVMSLAQDAPVPVEKEPFHTLSFRNEHVVVLRVEIPPHQTTQLHQHVRQYLTVSLADARITSTVPVAPNLPQPPLVQETRRKGEAWMAEPVVHTVRNDGDRPFRATVVEFLACQKNLKPVNRKPSRYCNPKSKVACVRERYLFCTDRLCVSEVEMGPGAITMKHSHSTDHMVIALSDLEMKDWIAGRPAAEMRDQKSGQTLFLDAGITHQVENGPQAARMIVVSWR